MAIQSHTIVDRHPFKYIKVKKLLMLYADVIAYFVTREYRKLQ